jgi:hypothetical protein
MGRGLVRDRGRRERKDAVVGIGGRRDIPVEVHGQWFLVVEVPGDGSAAPDDLALRLLVDRVEALARALERAERERDAQAAECARLRVANGAAKAVTASASLAAAAEVARSWEVPGMLRTRRRATLPDRIRWPVWRR